MKHTPDGWIISDKLPFAITGKYAEISFEISGNTAVLSPDGEGPTVTFIGTEGGRGAHGRVSASYVLATDKLKLKP